MPRSSDEVSREYALDEARPMAWPHPLFGCDHHRHLPAFHLGELLHLAKLDQIAAHALEHAHADLLVNELAAPEAKGDLDLVAFLEKLHDRAHLDLIIVVVDRGTHLDLLDLDYLLFLARLVLLLLFLVFELAEIEDLDDRRFGQWCDL